MRLVVTAPDRHAGASLARVGVQVALWGLSPHKRAANLKPQADGGHQKGVRGLASTSPCA
jgi:hypothetical protein